MYDAYSFAVIPRIGGLVAGDADSYQYLVESIRQFPDQVRQARYCLLHKCSQPAMPAVLFHEQAEHPMSKQSIP